MANDTGMNPGPSTVAEIDLEAIAFNVRSIAAKVSPAAVMAVVKADGYGHGAVEVARTALDAGATTLAVASIEEGKRLRNAGITAPILVLVTFFSEDAPAILEYRLEAVVGDMERATALSEAAARIQRKAAVHVKVDTGMGRLGVSCADAPRFVRSLLALPGLELKAVFTHFANSDAADKTFARAQLQKYREVLARLQEAGVSIPLRHAANSGAILDLPDTYFDLVRAGVSMYGYYPSQATSESIPLKPAMRLKSRVMALRDLPAGHNVSYNLTYSTARDTQIAVIAAGYADGWNRLLSNQAEVLIRGRRYPLVGTVCMDLSMVDVGPASGLAVGDEVVLLGRQGKEGISVYELCRKLNTIPYEITCWVSKRVPRVYRKNELQKVETQTIPN